MATTSSTTKAKQDLTKAKSLNRKPKAPSSVSSEDGSSEQKPEKPLPNYLKPTISSRPDPVKFLKKNNNSLVDNQKLLRRRSFDRPPSSLTSPSTSSSPQKSLNVSPLPRDRPTVPREKPVTAQRSSSFHGSRGVPRGGTTVKSSHVVPKKSGLSSSSTSLKSKKENSSNVTIVKLADKEFPLDSASLASAQEDDHQEEILKVEGDVHVADHGIEEPKDEKVTQEVQVEDVQAHEENVSGGTTTVASSPVVEDCVVLLVVEKQEEELINEEKTEEKIEETKVQENNQDNKVEKEEEVVKKNIDDEHESPKKVDIDMKEVESVQDTPEEKEEEMKEVEKEEVKEEKEKLKEEVKDEEVKEDQKEKVKEEEKEKVKEEEEKKKEVVKGKKGSPSAYNDVIASKMQENPRKNKVLALAGAFQTVIDYETTAASK